MLFVGQISDICRTESVGQITNLSDRFKFCRTDSNGTIYVSDFCRTDLSNKTDLSDRKQNLLFVEQILFVFCVCRTESVGQIFLRICRTDNK